MTRCTSAQSLTHPTADGVSDGAPRASRAGTHRRRLWAAAAVAGALALAGCGGGGGGGGADVSDEPAAALQVGVVAGTTTYAPVLQGQALDVSANVGQSIVLDANEPVVWRFSANGSPLFADGTTVDLGGVTLTESQVNASQVVFDSSFYGPALVPIDVLLTATSTIDNAQVATIRLVLQ